MINIPKVKVGIVAVSRDCFPESLAVNRRKALVEAIRYVDLVIPENSWTQKRSDMHEYHIDTFVIGDDWEGKFDFLKEEGVEVVYLPRTPEVSSSQIKKEIYDANSVDGETRLSHDEINTDPDH